MKFSVLSGTVIAVGLAASNALAQGYGLTFFDQGHANDSDSASIVAPGVDVENLPATTYRDSFNLLTGGGQSSVFSGMIDNGGFQASSRTTTSPGNGFNSAYNGADLYSFASSAESMGCFRLWEPA